MMIAEEGQSHRHVQGSYRVHAEPDGNQVADDRREQDLAESRGQGDRAGGADQVQVEPESYQKQQDRIPHAGKQLDRAVRLHPAEAGRADQDAHADERDDQWLTQPDGQQSDESRDRQDGGDQGEPVQLHGFRSFTAGVRGSPCFLPPPTRSGRAVDEGA
jgi:hypothetical protein